MILLRQTGRVFCMMAFGRQIECGHPDCPLRFGNLTQLFSHYFNSHRSPSKEAFAENLASRYTDEELRARRETTFNSEWESYTAAIVCIEYNTFFTDTFRAARGVATAVI